MPNIIRLWRGKTSLEKADAYEQLMKTLAAPDYCKVPGLVSYKFTRSNNKDFAEFLLITEWTSYDAIRQFAGDDFVKAKYYPQDESYLLDFPKYVEHFEVFDMSDKV